MMMMMTRLVSHILLIRLMLHVGASHVQGATHEQYDLLPYSSTKSLRGLDVDQDSSDKERRAMMMMMGEHSDMMGGSDNNMMMNTSADDDDDDFMVGLKEEEMSTIHLLFEHHEEIVRTFHINGATVMTETKSTNPQVSEWIRRHVSQMMEKVELGDRVRQCDPLFASLFNHRQEIEQYPEYTDAGVKMVLLGKTQCGAALAHAHAETVTAFVNNGFPEMHVMHAVPKECSSNATESNNHSATSNGTMSSFSNEQDKKHVALSPAELEPSQDQQENNPTSAAESHHISTRTSSCSDYITCMTILAVIVSLAALITTTTAAVIVTCRKRRFGSPTKVTTKDHCYGVVYPCGT